MLQLKLVNGLGRFGAKNWKLLIDLLACWRHWLWLYHGLLVFFGNLHAGTKSSLLKCALSALFELVGLHECRVNTVSELDEVLYDWFDLSWVFALSLLLEGLGRLW